MNKLWINPVLLGVAGLIGWMVCRYIGKPEQARMVLMAVGSCMIALLLGTMPLVLRFENSVSATTQTALLGSVIFLMAAVALTAIVMFVFKPGIGFVVWMCGFFWLTLIGQALTAIRALRSASAASGK
jgi:hypothetical protein